jgi:hypothetical protein
MSSSTGVGQRVYILLSVLAALAAPTGFFLVRGAENTLFNAILKECEGDSFSLFSVCFDKAWREGTLAFWQYLLPFIPAVLIACGRWVLGFPRPSFAFSVSWFYLIVEAILVLLGIFVTLSSVYDAWVKPIEDLEKQRILLGSSYLALAVLGAPLILSILLERPRAERSYKFVRLGFLIVLVALIAAIAISIFRQASRVR